MDTTTKRILIVDDTPENIQVLGSVLRKYDYLINVAQNGQQALDAVAKVKPDLVLLDVMMPVMDGFETCKRLKSDPATSDIPVIFLTARIEPEDIVKGLELGGVDYVGKPFNAAELMQRVRTHLKIRELQQSLEHQINELDRAAGTIARMARENESFLRHELNNALSPVLGYADLLVKNPDEDAARRVSWAEIIKDKAESIRELMEALRSLQALERGAHDLNPEPVDVARMIEEEINHSQMASDQKIEVERPVENIFLSADPTLLPGVFRNLIKNAVEHVRGLSPEEQWVKVVISDQGSEVEIKISNGGVPIPLELQEHFFEKFNSTRSQQGGTGLGTSYAYVVVKAHGGDIVVSSSETEGTSITIRLPK